MNQYPSVFYLKSSLRRMSNKINVHSGRVVISFSAATAKFEVVLGDPKNRNFGGQAPPNFGQAALNFGQATPNFGQAGPD